MAKKIVVLFLLVFVSFYHGTSEGFITKVNSMTEEDNLFESGEQLAELLHISMSEADVELMLGSDYVQGTSMMTNEKIWRYDFVSNEAYENNRTDDEVDLEALHHDDVKFIVFITFADNSERMNHIAMYYKNAQGHIYEYMQFSDGSTKNLLIAH